ncbi:MAG: hypothetical protein A2152_02655 [Candidatus Levybacteria bacterium RBG_16_35_6]|nr:MAG: hypothetical protein A2152_02655 [Candidatus Levybacteria bacterium RBG_16_35_6]
MNAEYIFRLLAYSHIFVGVGLVLFGLGIIFTFFAIFKLFKKKNFVIKLLISGIILIVFDFLFRLLIEIIFPTISFN